MTDEYLNELESQIDFKKLEELEDIKGQGFAYFASHVINDTKIMEYFIIILSMMADGRYITVGSDLAKLSIEFKKKRKAFLLNIILDVFYFLGFTKYEKISQEQILIKIVNEEFCDKLNNIKIEMINSNIDLSELNNVLKAYNNDSTTTS